MNNTPDNQRLLADLLAEGPAAGLRESLLHQTLCLVRRRRRFRQARQGVSALVLLVGLGLLAWRLFPPGPPLTSRPYLLVRTHPLPAAALVETRPLSPATLITSSSQASIITTASAAGRRLEEISDDELLALIAPRPVALVHVGPHTARLIFLDPADEKALLR